MTQEELLNKAYMLGWIECACWAKRTDLIADVDSPEYKSDRMAHMDSIHDESPPAKYATWLVETGLAEPEPKATGEGCSVSSWR